MKPKNPTVPIGVFIEKTLFDNIKHWCDKNDVPRERFYYCAIAHAYATVDILPSSQRDLLLTLLKSKPFSPHKTT